MSKWDNETKYLGHDFRRVIFEIIATSINRPPSYNRLPLTREKKSTLAITRGITVPGLPYCLSPDTLLHFRSLW